MAKAAKVVSIETKQAMPAKNPAAVALGRLGGLKGGKARADKLSDARKTEIARAAALKRWEAKKKPEAEYSSKASGLAR
jgi:hypothetical protein